MCSQHFTVSWFHKSQYNMSFLLDIPIFGDLKIRYPDISADIFLYFSDTKQKHILLDFVMYSYLFKYLNFAWLSSDQLVVVCSIPKSIVPNREVAELPLVDKPCGHW